MHARMVTRPSLSLLSRISIVLASCKFGFHFGAQSQACGLILPLHGNDAISMWCTNVVRLENVDDCRNETVAALALQLQPSR